MVGWHRYSRWQALPCLYGLSRQIPRLSSAEIRYAQADKCKKWGQVLHYHIYPRVFTSAGKLVRFHHVLTNNIALNLIGAFNNMQHFCLSKYCSMRLSFETPEQVNNCTASVAISMAISVVNNLAMALIGASFRPASASAAAL